MKPLEICTWSNISYISHDHYYKLIELTRAFKEIYFYLSYDIASGIVFPLGPFSMALRHALFLERHALFLCAMPLF